MTQGDVRRAHLLVLAGREQDAEAIYRQAAETPALRIGALQGLRHLLFMQQRFEELLAADLALLELQPNNPRNAVQLARTLLALGRYEEAWPHFAARATSPALGVQPKHAFPEWQGEPVRSLLVWDEQGAGDSIQFVRFVPELVRRGVSVTLACRRQLAPLYQALGAKIVIADGDVVVEPHDAWTLLMSLPWRMGLGIQDLPAGPYLAAPEDRRRKWRLQGPRVGVVTRGNPGHFFDAERSLPPLAEAFVRSYPGVISLRPEDGALPLADYADTAAVIEGLDAVVTVDTSVAHLAGALGKTCFVLLPYRGLDWRWMVGRSDSPWYPSLRLFRQPAPGAWAPALLGVEQALHAALNPPQTADA